MKGQEFSKSIELFIQLYDKTRSIIVLNCVFGEFITKVEKFLETKKVWT